MEVADALDEADEIGRIRKIAGHRSAIDRIAPQRKNIANARIGKTFENLDDLVLREVKPGQVGDGRNLILVLNLGNDIKGVSGILGAAGAIGDGNEIRLNGTETIQRAIDGFNGRGTLGRKNLKGKGALHMASLVCRMGTSK